MALRIARAELAAPVAQLDALTGFYGETLGLTAEHVGGGRVAFRIGDDVLEFVASEEDAQPFHHFALLVPGDRFGAAHVWLGDRVELLVLDGDTVVAFDSWKAWATYFHDPAGNIVELIAHAGVAERTDVRGAFSPAELAGLSEVAVVIDQPADGVAALGRELGLDLWSGDANDLAFVGAKARTLIISPPDRGWVPTGRPAERHAATVTFTGGGRGDTEVTLASAPVRRVRRTA